MEYIGKTGDAVVRALIRLWRESWLSGVQKKKRLPDGWTQFNLELSKDLLSEVRVAAKLDGSRTAAAFLRHAAHDRLKKVREDQMLRGKLKED